jgi:putative DNA primase/helicase
MVGCDMNSQREQTIPIAFVESRTSGVVKSLSLDWVKLSERLSRCDVGDKDGSGWMPADIEPGSRTAERVKSVSALVFDCEAKAETVDGVKKVVGAEPPALDAMLAEVGLSGWCCILHTSFSHAVEHPRYRLTFSLSRPLAPAEVKPLGLHVAAILGIGDCIDTGCLEPARLFYLPRCSVDRKDLFRHAETQGVALPVDELLAQTAQIDDAQKSAPRRTGQSGNVIEAFNDVHDVGAILEQHGYEKRDKGRWLWPGSTTGLAGVRLLPDANPQRVYSSHGGDPLNDGHAHDAFDLFKILHHGGEMSAAVKDAARICGVEHSRTPARAEHQPGEENEPGKYPDGDGWPEPQALVTEVEPEAYPLDALPDTIRAAVAEVAGFVKAPVPLVASSALAAISLAIQTHADAKRADKLTGPVGLFLLTIADSGERKSTCDGFFTKAIRDYEAKQAEAAKPILNDHRAAIEAWEAKRAGIKDSIRQLAKGNKPTLGAESELRKLEHDKPQPPRIPRLLYADATPEALAYGLAKQWPSGGVVSAEGGIVFGSHGMGKDSVMRNLAMLNQLWDGNNLTIDRRTTESFTVKGARLTVALQVQEPTLREFFDRSGALARGTGFLARFLVAWPESTQGLRPFTEAPENWPHLAAFNRRIAAILDQPVPIDDDGALTPPMLALTAEAKEAWVKYHNAIEGELASGGELYDVRDVASKSADNAARLAALFHVFISTNSNFIISNIQSAEIESASRIAAWHLNESRRFFGELALPVELANAARLDSWLTAYCKRERTHMVPIAKLQQGGPGGLRSKAIIETTVRELEEAGRARWVRDGKRKMIAVNPALLIEGSAT